MLKDVLKNLRKANHLTQEDLADKVHVSRQSIAKWENGESIPDIYNIQELANVFHVSIDSLLEADTLDACNVPPKGKYMFGYVTIDENGCIQLPEECLDTFHFTTGQQLLLFGDIKQGLALCNPNEFEQFAQELMNLKKGKNHD